MRASSSRNHFLDTNVLLRHANNDSGNQTQDVQRILDEAAQNQRQLWVSSILFAELRPSSFVPGVFKDVGDLARYIRSVATVVSIDPNMAMRAARLRDCRWQRPERARAKGEKPKCMSLGDAIHVVSALWVIEELQIPDVEFFTFDAGRSKTSELDEGTKPLSLLHLEKYTDGIAANPDVMAVVRLPRMMPVLSQGALPLPPPPPPAAGLPAPSAQSPATP